MRRLGPLLFWGSVGTLLYTFVLFPALAIVRGSLRPRPATSGPGRPTMSVIIAAHNESDGIGPKLDNLLGLDYPSGSCQVIVVSDGSDDGTDAIVRDYEARGVRLLSLPRSGKGAALEAGARASAADVLVFSDANSFFSTDALTALARPFSDPEVGGVAGNQVYRSPRAADGGEAGERAYWAFDRMLKEFESRAGNTISATGAIYAIRRELFRPIPPGVNDDFFLSLGVIQQGRRLVFAADAIAFEPPSSSLDAEFRRKVRVVSRAMRCVADLRELLDVRRYGFYAVQLFSHKVLRWAMIVPVLLISLTSLGLAHRGGVYRITAAAAVAGYLAAAAGIALRSTRLGRSRILSVPAYFVMANAAVAVAAWNLFRGRRIDQWRPSRDPVAPDAHRPRGSRNVPQ